MLRQTMPFVLVLFSLSCLAQHKVTGTIVDELGLPVNKAKITLDDSSTVIFTNYTGDFSITSETDFYWKIHISCEGFLNETYYVLDGGNTGNITLEYDVNIEKLMYDDNGFIFKKDYDFRQNRLAFFDSRKLNGLFVR